MSFQLRRMLLVNAGTNKNRASGRITEIDPRGGAAVIGANGVGKTSTLRLIPLFFGHPTSQVVALNEGQEGVRFILPSSTSAICFEYQRGTDDPENLRLAVMRPRADADAPEYRIYPCGFRKELFVQDGRFVTDEVTNEIALKGGIQPTHKLNTAEYRSVILGGRSFSKEHKRLAAYARQHSFGPRELPNLDKLVATMVKHGVKFEDLVQVAVGLIELERGGDQRQRLTFRQQRQQLQAWLRNVQAAKLAIAAEPRVNFLRGMADDHIAFEQEWRHLHFQVLRVREARELEKSGQDAKLQELNTARQSALVVENAIATKLQEAARLASAEAGRANQEYENARGEQSQFDKDNAAGWALRMQELAPLQSKREGLAGQLAAALSGMEALEGAYRLEEDRIRGDARDRRSVMEQSKAPLHRDFDTQRGSVEDSQRTALKELAARTGAARTELDEQVNPLRESAGSLRAQAQNPAAPAELQRAIKDARQRRDNHAGELGRLGDRLQRAERTHGESKTAFESAERHLAAARQRTGHAREALRREQSLLRPADGTLVSALRGHPDQHWKTNLARVIDPQLLERADLSPRAEAGDDDSLYGWQLAIERIDAPVWSNDTLQRQAVDDAQAELDRITKAEAEASQALARCAAALDEAGRRLREDEAEKSVLVGRQGALREAIADAEEALQAALREAANKAQTQLQQTQAKINDLTRQLSLLSQHDAQEQAQIQRDHGQRLEAARSRRDNALAAIEASLEQLDADLSERLTKLGAQLAQHLRSQGIDAEAVQALRDDLADHDTQIRNLTSRQYLVDNWQAWLKAGGEQRVASLGDAAQRAARAAADATERVETHTAGMRATQSAHAVAERAFLQQISQLDTDIAILAGMPALFDDYAPVRYEGVDLAPRAAELKKAVLKKKGEVNESERGMKSLFLQLHKDLTAHDSSTKDLIEGQLAGAGQSTYAQARGLASAWWMLGTQVIPDIRNTLQTVLANIGSFHRSIRSFETEVDAFNTRLQEALKEVKRFERVDELHLDIVADFDTLPFYKDLRRMADIGREQQPNAALQRMELSPGIDSTVEAIGSFLGVIGADGALEVNLAAHISLRGSVIENGRPKVFRRASELEGVSSEGLTSLILITLLIGLVNTVRRGDDVHVPWITDEVGRFDPGNFAALMRMLADNRIDVITASPALDLAQFAHFANRYVFEDSGVVKRYFSAPALEELA
jgi:hypothetical protein